MLTAQMALVKIKPYVRFGSKADMCSAQADVRFVPIADMTWFIRLSGRRGREVMAAR